MGREMNSNYHNLTSRLNLWLLRSRKRFRSICAIFQYFHGLSFTQNNGRSRKIMVVHARFTLVHARSRSFTPFHADSRCFTSFRADICCIARSNLGRHLVGSDFGLTMNYYIYTILYITLYHNIFFSKVLNAASEWLKCFCQESWQINGMVCVVEPPQALLVPS